eukprot:1421840-Amphidinium_carterae.1
MDRGVDTCRCTTQQQPPKQHRMLCSLRNYSARFFSTAVRGGPSAESCCKSRVVCKLRGDKRVTHTSLCALICIAAGRKVNCPRRYVHQPHNKASAST